MLHTNNCSRISEGVLALVRIVVIQLPREPIFATTLFMHQIPVHEQINIGCRKKTWETFKTLPLAERSDMSCSHCATVADSGHWPKS